VWPQSSRNKRFSELISNYYYSIYLGHKKERPNESQAPKNFWQYSYQFYICNPVLVFSCTINDSLTNHFIAIERYTEPNVDRQKIDSVNMPPDLVKEDKLDTLLETAQVDELLKVA